MSNSNRIIICSYCNYYWIEHSIFHLLRKTLAIVFPIFKILNTSFRPLFCHLNRSHLHLIPVQCLKASSRALLATALCLLATILRQNQRNKGRSSSSAVAQKGNCCKAAPSRAPQPGSGGSSAACSGSSMYCCHARSSNPFTTGCGDWKMSSANTARADLTAMVACRGCAGAALAVGTF